MKKALDYLAGQGVNRDREIQDSEERACEIEQQLFLTARAQAQANRKLEPRVTQVMERIKSQNNGESKNHV